MNIPAQIVGIFGIISAILIYQQKTRKGLMITKLISDVFWVFHYLILGAYSGVAVCILAVLRELIFINKGRRKWANHIIWPILFVLAAIGTTIFTWEGPISILAGVASALSVVSFWIGSPKLTRIFIFPIATLMIIYDVFSGSYTGIINESITLVSAFIGIIRLDIKGNHNKPHKVIDIIGDNYVGSFSKTRIASRAIIIKDGEILLSYEEKNDQWMIPGGGKEDNETEKECAIRETLEETGYVIKSSDCLFEIDEYYENCKYASYYFFGEILDKTQQNLTQAEINANMIPKWISIDKITNIFEKYNDYKYNEMRRGLYLREYTALKEYAKICK